MIAATFWEVSEKKLDNAQLPPPSAANKRRGTQSYEHPIARVNGRYEMDGPGISRTVLIAMLLAHNRSSGGFRALVCSAPETKEDGSFRTSPTRQSHVTRYDGNEGIYIVKGPDVLTTYEEVSDAVQQPELRIAIPPRLGVQSTVGGCALESSVLLFQDGSWTPV